MSDPRTFEDYTTSFDECDVCEHVNRVTYWESDLTHKWSRDSFDCIGCGEHHSEIVGNNLDRGSSVTGFSIRMCGWALVMVGVLAHSHWTVPLIATGVAMVATVRIVTAFINANRIVKEAPHE